MRDRAWSRKMSVKKARRNKRITEEVCPLVKNCPMYDNLHQYSKKKFSFSRLSSRDKWFGRKKDESFVQNLLEEEEEEEEEE